MSFSTESYCTSVWDSKLRLSRLVTVVLLASGLTHLTLIAILGASWEGGVSLRKPALFGISGGLTTASIAWLMTQLTSRKHDHLISNSIAVGLLVEVALITMQYWRGVPSHFNHSTPLDAISESAMLGLILAVTLAIFYLSYRTMQLRTPGPAMALAIRSGMWLLTFSCGLGILTTALGEFNIASGRSHELWGRAGVLKFPHGAALHAIQFLPFVAWAAVHMHLRNPLRVVQAVLGAQVFFLTYAIWQTAQGQSRFDLDVIGALLLGITASLGLYPILAIIKDGLIAAYSARDVR